jgi:hypothetical protein
MIKIVSRYELRFERTILMLYATPFNTSDLRGSAVSDVPQHVLDG